MSHKDFNQRSLADSLVTDHKALHDFDDINKLIGWQEVKELLAGIHDKKCGNSAYPPLLMFKALLLQAWYGMSDSQLEDVCRQIAKLPDVAEQQARAHLQPLFDKIQRLQTQKRDSKNKLYSLHAPEVECISKGKAHKRYEFGVKVGVVISQRGSWVLGCRSFTDNPYDGDTLHSSLEQASNISGVMPQEAYVDLGYRGKHLLPPNTEFDNIKVIHRNKRNKTPQQRKGLRQRSAIEAMIGHMKNDGKLGRNWLKGVEGDAHNAILCAVGQNFRKLLMQSW